MLYPSNPFPNPPHRVVVTGMGIVTPFGIGIETNQAGFRAGRCALRPATLFDVSRQRCQIAGEVSVPGQAPPSALSNRRYRRTDRATRILMWAASEALSEAGWSSRPECAVVLGTTSAGMPQGEAYFSALMETSSVRQGRATQILNYQAQRQVLDLMESFNLRGTPTILSSACASGADALGCAWQMIRHGSAARALAGGFEGLSRLVFCGFDSLQALSREPCRPFDQHRDGLTLGEGAGILALESLPEAETRKARILGEVVGYGACTDTHHLTQPHPEGAAAIRAMTQACATAGIRPDQVGYINAHGTGTLLNDSSEAAAIQSWAGPHAPSRAVSSTKGSVGHSLGASGAIEAIVCLLALRGGWLPPNASLQNPDPVCPFEIVKAPTDRPVEFALSNSFGFGGSNASLAFRRWT